MNYVKLCSTVNPVEAIGQPGTMDSMDTQTRELHPNRALFKDRQCRSTVAHTVLIETDGPATQSVVHGPLPRAGLSVFASVLRVLPRLVCPPSCALSSWLLPFRRTRFAPRASVAAPLG